MSPLSTAYKEEDEPKRIQTQGPFAHQASVRKPEFLRRKMNQIGFKHKVHFLIKKHTITTVFEEENEPIRI